MTRALALVALAGALGCGGGPFQLDLSIHLGSDIDPGTESRITTFDLEVTGGETYGEKVPLGRAPDEVERLVYHPKPSTQHIDLTIDATDGTNVLASGSTSIALGSGTTDADVTLDLVAAQPDLAVDDLAMPAVDAAIAPPDMTLVCPTNALCFDFEPGETLPPQYGSGDCAIATDITYHGTQSLHCTGTAMSYMAASLGPDPGGPIAIRAHVYSNGPSTNTGTASYVGLVVGSLGAYAGDYGAKDFGFEYSTNASSFEEHSVAKSDGPGWHCVEIVFTPPSSVVVYLDTVAMSAPETDFYTNGNGKLDASFGLPTISGTATFWDVYLDDIVFSYGRVGCD